ncbi:hypothetical protein [Sphingomonas sp.]|jgi:hypothetical protein|uniref:hypothetical protein n=1 Tax=Sphingomonas sp. TaxID=28214 RepID=UPI002E12A8D5|nr:hypothetical protein [Sphingomonas sp.]
MFFSPSTGGFYDPAINRDIPADAVRISRERHGELIAARAAGKIIAPDRAGRPVAREPRIGIDQLRTRAVASVKGEARRRILAVASLEQQANDNATIAIEAFAGVGADMEGALDRRARIDAIRTASNAIEAQIARMPAANLTAFDPSLHPLWPEHS